MEQAEVEAILSSALAALYEEDLAIIRLDVGERTITPQLCAILQRYFGEHSVHAEYNRHGILPKEIEMPDADGVPTLTRVFPDIIVHQPAHDGQNLLIIEVKKSTNPVGDDGDLIKLDQMKRQLGYRFAAFVRLATGPGAELKDVRLSWV
jgi:hypothetical protein